MKNHLIHINKKQGIIVTSGIILILLTVIAWAIQGFHLFTHDKIMRQLPQSDIEKLLNQPPRFTWINHFTLGLEYTLLISAAIVTFCTILFFFFKNRKEI